MFDIIRAVVLGFVQGATEFIPVSSSGHLVLVPWLLGWEPSTLLFDAVLHWGTLASILLVFWRDFWAILVAWFRSISARSLADPQARLGWYIILGTLPVVVAGLTVKDTLEAVFTGVAGPRLAGIFLLVTAAILAGSELLARHRQARIGLTQLRAGQAIIVGLAQAVALAPGISRSGATIATGLATGIRRDEAARFSFFLGAPAFLGAGLLELTSVMTEAPDQVAAQAPALLVGFLVSAVTGFVAIRFLLAYLRRRSLYPFALYCLLVGLLVFALTA